MTNDLATRPRTELDEMTALAESAARSNYFPGIKTTDQALTLMALCRSEGLDPMQALRRYHLIETRDEKTNTTRCFPVMRADAMQAEFQRQGGRIEWVRYDAELCDAVFSHPVHAPKGVRITFSIDDAKRAGLAHRAVWQKHPANMLRSRCVTNGIRMVMPGVVVGIYTEDEILETIEPVTIDVVATPAAPPSPPARTKPAPVSAPRPAPTVDAVRVRTMPEGETTDPRSYVDLVLQEAQALTLDIREHTPDAKEITKFQLHRHLVKAAIEAGFLPAFPPDAKVANARIVELGQDLYRDERDWVRTELARYVDAIYEASKPSEAAAQPVREPGEEG